MHQSSETVHEAFRHELPVLPVVITTLMSLNIEQDDYFDAVTRLARLDPCLAIKILRQAALLSTASGGDTVPRAMMCIGVMELERLVSEHSSARVFVPTSDAEKGMWMHFIQVALIAEALAKSLPQLGVDPEQAHLAGLTHDVGRLIQYDQSALSANKMANSDYTTPGTLLVAEAKIIGATHVEIAAETTEAWGLPEYLKETIRHHHDRMPELRDELGATRKTIELVQFADEISVFALRNGSLETGEFSGLVEDYMARKSVYLKEVELSLDALIQICDRFLEASEEEFLQLKLGPIAAYADYEYEDLE